MNYIYILYKAGGNLGNFSVFCTLCVTLKPDLGLWGDDQSHESHSEWSGSWLALAGLILGH